ncbi:pyridoxal-phosphate-dependent aminotransferase family protein [Endozoicomonas euniceicola]|uniref:Alanine--glyoxylate aminotransferase family protein n=1 Tax=Endozoicomonas euniceicola TaxID=1234143 RepID=A0ABY6GXR4_9GAMM|nr:alanine--glyoxylate aminotransferase family protein [Endozoicomonas euniceicola]UYM16744.1 alanine--glyoxylate aminotransferase family protein [Endozoicomonas euniceicola]
MSISSFYPPQRILMGPGPTDVHPKVLQALSRPTIGHLDPAFIGMMDEVRTLLQYAFQTENGCTMAVSAPGSAGMEACFVNLIEPGDKVVVCINGVFGNRMAENVVRSGGQLVKVEDDWGRPVSPDKLEEALKAHPDARIVAFVHAETSTGVLSDAKKLCSLAKQHNCLSIVDAVTSLGGVPLFVDDWGIDAIYSGTQKCLSSVPGISPVSFSDAAVAKIKGRKTPVQSWFLDQSLVMSYWGGKQKRSYHHTAPVNALYAVHESLLNLREEGLSNAWQRHAEQHETLRLGLEKLGISFIVDEACRLPQLNTVAIPDGVDDETVRSRLLDHYNLEIGSGLGAFTGEVWRIGLMGYGARAENVALCLRALEETLN